MENGVEINVKFLPKTMMNTMKIKNILFLILLSDVLYHHKGN
jgi:hypothetical protein